MAAFDWRSMGECRPENGHDPELWFPTTAKETNPKYTVETAPARQICSGCPVKQDCLDFALEHRMFQYGIFGGFSPNERKELIRRERRMTA